MLQSSQTQKEKKRTCFVATLSNTDLQTCSYTRVSNTRYQPNSLVPMITDYNWTMSNTLGVRIRVWKHLRRLEKRAGNFKKQTKHLTTVLRRFTCHQVTIPGVSGGCNSTWGVCTCFKTISTISLDITTILRVRALKNVVKQVDICWPCRLSSSWFTKSDISASEPQTSPGTYF